MGKAATVSVLALAVACAMSALSDIVLENDAFKLVVGDDARLRGHKRASDILETMRRWEDVRAKNWLTKEQKEMLKSPTKEHHLYLNEKGEYELEKDKQVEKNA